MYYLNETILCLSIYNIGYIIFFIHSIMGSPSKSVIDVYPYLLILSVNRKNKTLQNILLRQKKVIHSISEIVLNLLSHNIPIDNHNKTKLKRYKSQLLILSRRGNFEVKIKILSSRQLLSILLTVSLPFLAQYYDGPKSRK